MKKLLILLMLFSFNANAESNQPNYLLRIIGAECGRILHELKWYEYPANYNHIKPRNSQFWALDKCLEIYKKNGGDLESLSDSFAKAEITYIFDSFDCDKIEDTIKKGECKERIKGKLLSNLAEPVGKKSN